MNDYTRRRLGRSSDEAEALRERGEILRELLRDCRRAEGIAFAQIGVLERALRGLIKFEFNSEEWDEAAGNAQDALAGEPTEAAPSAEVERLRAIAHDTFDVLMLNLSPEHPLRASLVERVVALRKTGAALSGETQ